jgi:signal transduction histidine kinase
VGVDRGQPRRSVQDTGAARPGVARRGAARRGVTLDTLYRLSIGTGIAATLLVLLPGVPGHLVLPTVDLAMDTTSLVVFAALMALAWARFRESRVIAAAFHAAAFQTLTVAYGMAVLVTLLQSDSISSLERPDNVQVLVFAVARLGAAAMFVAAGVSTARRLHGWQPLWILVAPMLGVFVVWLVGTWASPLPDAFQIIAFSDGSALPHATLFGASVHLVTACLFFAGAYVSRGQWHVGNASIDGWIAVGLVFAGFGELTWTLFPSAHPGQVSAGDVFRLVCAVALLVGLESAVRSGLRELRTANVELAELRDSEVARAALEERTRLARELHDGLAQDLWLAKLRTGELASMPGLSDAARQAARDAANAIDIGLGEAREAVAALRSSAEPGSGLPTLVRRTVEDYADRFGLRVEFAFDGDASVRIAPRTQAEILRIAQEALTNVAKHADASVVGVRLAIAEERITLRVDDNGRGFDLADVRPGSFGMASMRERAALIGGRLRIASRPGDGTRVMLSAPFVRPSVVPARDSS